MITYLTVESKKIILLNVRVNYVRYYNKIAFFKCLSICFFRVISETTRTDFDGTFTGRLLKLLML